MKGRIYSSIGGIYHIKDNNNVMHFLPAAGVFRHKEITPIVGDWVEFEEQKYISSIYPRKNEFIRPKVANIDHIIVVMSVKEPEFSSYLVDKYLSIIEYKKIEPIIFVTKEDLGSCPFANEYKKMNYQIFEISNKTDEWVKKIQIIFKNKTCSLMGQSGVGKTTIVNKITSSNFETQNISKNVNRGKHTTRYVQILDVFEGQLIDTPGFSELNLNLTKEELSKSFKQFAELSKMCKFRTCLHTDEPEEYCNIKQSIKKGIIPAFRYSNYLKLLKEAKNE